MNKQIWLDVIATGEPFRLLFMKAFLTNRRTNICYSRVAFMTENPSFVRGGYGQPLDI